MKKGKKIFILFFFGVMTGGVLMYFGIYLQFINVPSNPGLGQEIIDHARRQQDYKFLDYEEWLEKSEDGASILYLAWPLNPHPEIKTWIKEQQSIFKEESQQTVKERKVFQKEIGKIPASLTLTRLLTFEMPFNNENLQVYRFLLETSSGGTGNAHNRVFIIAGKDILNSQDIFRNTRIALSFMAPLVRRQMFITYGKKSLNVHGLIPNPDNYRHLGITSDMNFIFYFDKYQVANGSKGSLSATISFEHVCDLVRPSFIKRIQDFWSCKSP